MSTPREGDLCYLARCCDCGHGEDKLGYIIVLELARGRTSTRCRFCDRVYYDSPFALWRHGRTGEGIVPVSWLRRIPPLSELEGQHETVTIKETV